jgi:hypothetical protein
MGCLVWFGLVWFGLAWLGLASRDQAGGVLSCAAVLRVGLGPTTPPLCRYAEYTTGLI